MFRIGKIEGACSVSVLSDDESMCNVQLQISIEDPKSSDGADVSTELLYVPSLPEQILDEVHAAIYRGVHGGIAALGGPLPKGGLLVKILQLHISSESTAYRADAGAAYSVIVGHMVAALVASLVSTKGTEISSHDKP